MDTLTGTLPNIAYPTTQLVIGLQNEGTLDVNSSLNDITQIVSPSIAIPQGTQISISGEVTFGEALSIDHTNNVFELEFLPMIADIQSNQLGALPTKSGISNTTAADVTGFTSIPYKAHFLGGNYYQNTPYGGGSYLPNGSLGTTFSTRTNLLDTFSDFNVFFKGPDQGAGICYGVVSQPGYQYVPRVGIQNTDGYTYSGSAAPSQYLQLNPLGQQLPAVSDFDPITSRFFGSLLQNFTREPGFIPMTMNEWFTCDSQLVNADLDLQLSDATPTDLALTTTSIWDFQGADPTTTQVVNTTVLDSPLNHEVCVYSICGLIPFPDRRMCPNDISGYGNIDFIITNGPQTYNPETTFPLLSPLLAAQKSAAQTSYQYGTPYSYDAYALTRLPLHGVNFSQFALQPGNFYLPIVTPAPLSLYPTSVRSSHDHLPNMLSNFWYAGQASLFGTIPYPAPNFSQGSVPSGCDGNWWPSQGLTQSSYGSHSTIAHELASAPYGWFCPPMFHPRRMDDALAPIGVYAGGPTRFATCYENWNASASSVSGNLMVIADVNLAWWGVSSWLYNQYLNTLGQDTYYTASAITMFSTKYILESSFGSGRYLFEDVGNMYPFNPANQMGPDMNYYLSQLTNTFAMSNVDLDTVGSSVVPNSKMEFETDSDGNLTSSAFPQFLFKPGRSACGSNWTFAPMISRNGMHELTSYAASLCVASSLSTGISRGAAGAAGFKNISAMGLAPASCASVRSMTYWEGSFDSNTFVGPTLQQPPFRSIGPSLQNSHLLMDQSGTEANNSMPTCGNVRTNARHNVLGGYCNGFLWNEETKTYSDIWKVKVQIVVPDGMYTSDQLLLYINRALSTNEVNGVTMTSNLKDWNGMSYLLNGIPTNISIEEDMDIVWTNCGILAQTNIAFPKHIDASAFRPVVGSLDNYGVGLAQSSPIPSTFPLPPEYFKRANCPKTRPFHIMRSSISAIRSNLTLELVSGYYVLTTAPSSMYTPVGQSTQTFQPGVICTSSATGFYSRTPVDFVVTAAQFVPITMSGTPTNLDWASIRNCWPGLLDFNNLSVVRSFHIGQYTHDFPLAAECTLVDNCAGPAVLAYPTMGYAYSVMSNNVFNPLQQTQCDGLSSMIVTAVSGTLGKFLGIAGQFFKPSTFSVTLSEGQRYGYSINPTTYLYEEEPSWSGMHPDAFIMISPHNFDSAAYDKLTWGTLNATPPPLGTPPNLTALGGSYNNGLPTPLLDGTQVSRYTYERLSACITTGTLLLAHSSKLSSSWQCYDVDPGWHRYQTAQNPESAIRFSGHDSTALQEAYCFDPLLSQTPSFIPNGASGLTVDAVNPFRNCAWMNLRVQPTWPPPRMSHLPHLQRMMNDALITKCPLTGIDVSPYSLEYTGSTKNLQGQLNNYNTLFSVTSGTPESGLAVTELTLLANHAPTFGSTPPPQAFVLPFLDLPIDNPTNSAMDPLSQYILDFTVASLGNVPREAGRTMIYGTRNSTQLNNYGYVAPTCSAQYPESSGIFVPAVLPAVALFNQNVFMGENYTGLTWGPGILSSNSTVWSDGLDNSIAYPMPIKPGMQDYVNPQNGYPFSGINDFNAVALSGNTRSHLLGNALPAIWNWGDSALPALPTCPPHENMNPFAAMPVWSDYIASIDQSTTVLFQNPQLANMWSCFNPNLTNWWNMQWRGACDNTNAVNNTIVSRLAAGETTLPNIDPPAFTVTPVLMSEYADLGAYYTRPIYRPGQWADYHTQNGFYKSGVQQTNIGLGGSQWSALTSNYAVTTVQASAIDPLDPFSLTIDSSAPSSFQIYYVYPDGKSNGMSPFNYHHLVYERESEVLLDRFATYATAPGTEMPPIRMGRQSIAIPNPRTIDQSAMLGVLTATIPLSYEAIPHNSIVVTTPYVAFGKLAALRNNADCNYALGVAGTPDVTQLEAMGCDMGSKRTSAYITYSTSPFNAQQKAYWNRRVQIMRERASYGPFYFVENHLPGYQTGTLFSSSAYSDALAPGGTQRTWQYAPVCYLGGPDVFPMHASSAQDPTSPIINNAPIFQKLNGYTTGPTSLAMICLQFESQELLLRSRTYFNGRCSDLIMPVQLLYQPNALDSMANFSVVTHALNSMNMSYYRLRFTTLEGSPLNITALNVTITINTALALPRVGNPGSMVDQQLLTAVPMLQTAPLPMDTAAVQNNRIGTQAPSSVPGNQGTRRSAGGTRLASATGDDDYGAKRTRPMGGEMEGSINNEDNDDDDDDTSIPSVHTAAGSSSSSVHTAAGGPTSSSSTSVPMPSLPTMRPASSATGSTPSRKLPTAPNPSLPTGGTGGTAPNPSLPTGGTAPNPSLPTGGTAPNPSLPTGGTAAAKAAADKAAADKAAADKAAADAAAMAKTAASLATPATPLAERSKKMSEAILAQAAAKKAAEDKQALEDKQRQDAADALKKQQEEAARLVREEAARKAEAERIAREEAQKKQAEADRVAREEAQKKQAEADRVAREEALKKQAEADRIAQEEAQKKQLEQERLAREEAERRRVAEEDARKQKEMDALRDVHAESQQKRKAAQKNDAEDFTIAMHKERRLRDNALEKELNQHVQKLGPYIPPSTLQVYQDHRDDTFENRERRYAKIIQDYTSNLPFYHTALEAHHLELNDAELAGNQGAIRAARQKIEDLKDKFVRERAANREQYYNEFPDINYFDGNPIPFRNELGGSINTPIKGSADPSTLVALSASTPAVGTMVPHTPGTMSKAPPSTGTGRPLPSLPAGASVRNTGPASKKALMFNSPASATTTTPSQKRLDNALSATSTTRVVPVSPPTMTQSSPEIEITYGDDPTSPPKVSAGKSATSPKTGASSSGLGVSVSAPSKTPPTLSPYASTTSSGIPAAQPTVSPPHVPLTRSRSRDPSPTGTGTATQLVTPVATPKTSRKAPKSTATPTQTLVPESQIAANNGTVLVADTQPSARPPAGPPSTRKGRKTIPETQPSQVSPTQPSMIVNETPRAARADSLANTPSTRRRNSNPGIDEANIIQGAGRTRRSSSDAK